MTTDTCPRCNAPAIRLGRRIVCGGHEQRGREPEHLLGCDWERARFRRAATEEPEPEPKRKLKSKRERVIDEIRQAPWRTAVELAIAAAVSEHMVRTVLADHPELERRKLGTQTPVSGAVPWRYAWPGAEARP